MAKRYYLANTFPEMPTVKILYAGIGLDCCYVGVSFLKSVCGARCIMDPFCGQGTVTAMANALGVDSVGIEISPKRCRRASSLDLTSKLELISSAMRIIHFVKSAVKCLPSDTLQVAVEGDNKPPSTAEDIDEETSVAVP